MRRKRLDDTMTTMKAQAEETPSICSTVGIYDCRLLLISGVAAWWAASTGGKHRNEGVDHSHLSRWR